MKRVRSHADSAAQMRASVTDTGLPRTLYVSALLPLQEWHRRVQSPTQSFRMLLSYLGL